jgi:hypothetical protein
MDDDKCLLASYNQAIYTIKVFTQTNEIIWISGVIDYRQK